MPTPTARMPIPIPIPIPGIMEAPNIPVLHAANDATFPVRALIDENNKTQFIIQNQMDKMPIMLKNSRIYQEETCQSQKKLSFTPFDNETDFDAQSQSSFSSDYERGEILKNLKLYQDILRQIEGENKQLQSELKVSHEAIVKFQSITESFRRNNEELQKRVKTICELNNSIQSQNQHLRIHIEEIMQQLIKERQEKNALIDSIEQTKKKIYQEVKFSTSQILYKEKNFYKDKQHYMLQELQNIKKTCKKQDQELENMKYALQYHWDKTHHKVYKITFSPLSKNQQPDTQKYLWSDSQLTFMESDGGYSRILGNNFQFGKGGNKQIRFKIKKVDYGCGYIGIDSIWKQNNYKYEAQLTKFDLDSFLDEQKVGEIKENSYYYLTLHMKRFQQDQILISWYVNQIIVKSNIFYEERNLFRIFMMLTNLHGKKTIISIA